MTPRIRGHSRVLAIHLATRGFGFAVFDGRERLVDWGVKETKHDKNQRTLYQLELLTQLYKPQAILLTDYTGSPHRRSPRIAVMNRCIAGFAAKQKVKVCFVRWTTVRGYFRRLGAHTKQQLAIRVAERFPELAPRVPPVRKPWMSEDHRMSIFLAAALACVYFGPPRAGEVESAK